ncbi:MAG: transketolase [Selenomonadaceae bacterium]|nr:transketolase [Selenomonadaceae bacterium]
MIEFTKGKIMTWSMAGASGTLGAGLLELADNDPDFAVVTSDLCFFSGLEKLKQKHPDKLYNVGIAEQNMVGAAAGMAKEGMHIWATTYASFASTRALDQVKVNMGYMKFPIRLAGLTSGYSVGILGATHMSIEDISIMRSIPNIVVLSPADCHETMKLILATTQIDAPIYLRLSGTMRTPIVYPEDYSLKIGKANMLREHDKSSIAIFATGTMVSNALMVEKILAAKDIFCNVYDVHTIKPLDKEAIFQNLNKSLLITMEEHSVIGGLGSAVAECICGAKQRPRQLVFGIADFYPHAASYDALIKCNGLDVDSMVAHIEEAIKDC